MPDEFGHLSGLEMSKEQYQKDLKLGQEFAQKRLDQATKQNELFQLQNQALYVQEQLIDVISGVTRYNCDNATREENVQEQIERITRWIAAMSSAKEELEKKDR